MRQYRGAYVDLYRMLLHNSIPNICFARNTTKALVQYAVRFFLQKIIYSSFRFSQSLKDTDKLLKRAANFHNYHCWHIAEILGKNAESVHTTYSCKFLPLHAIVQDIFQTAYISSSLWGKIKNIYLGMYYRICQDFLSPLDPKMAPQ